MILNTISTYQAFNFFCFVLQEVVFHAIATILYLAASLTLLIEVNNRRNNYGKNYYEAYFAAAVSLNQTIIVLFT